MKPHLLHLQIYDEKLPMLIKLHDMNNFISAKIINVITLPICVTFVLVLETLSVIVVVFFFELGLTSCIAKQRLQDTELQEKEAQKH